MIGFNNYKQVAFLFLIIILPQIMYCQSAYIFLAKTYAEEGNLQEANIYENKALEILESISDKDNYDYAKNLNDLAEYYDCVHNYQRAIECETKVSQIIEQSIGKDNVAYVNSLYFLAKYYSRFGNRDKAIELCNQVNELLHSFFVKDPKYLMTLNHVSRFYSELNAYNEGLALDFELLDLIKLQLGEEHPYYSSCLSDIAVDYLYLGDFEKAKEFETIALEFRGRLLGHNHPDYAVSLNILAMCYSRMGDNEYAIKLSEECKDILKQSTGMRDVDYSKCLSNLAEYYSEIGDYKTAIEYNKEAYKIIVELMGQNAPDYIVLMQNRSKYYIYAGMYEEGIKLGYETIDILNQNFGKNNTNYATILGNLSVAYFELGNYDLSIELITEALQIMGNIVGTDHADYATILHLLSGYYYAKGDLKKAIEMEEYAMEIRKIVLGETHPYYATSLGTLSNYYYIMGDWETALSFNEYAKNVIMQTLGVTHKDYATVLNNRSLIYASMGNFNEALNLTKNAIHIVTAYTGKKNAKYLTYLLWLTHIYNEIGDYEHLEEIIAEAYSIIHNEIRSVFSYLPNNERKNYWDNRGGWLQYNLPYYLFSSRSESLNGVAYNGILLSKGILLNSELEFNRFITTSFSESLLEEFDKLKIIKLQIDKYYNNPISENNSKIDSLLRVATELERELMYKSKEFGDYTRNLSITWNDIKNNLKIDDAAIEFVSFPVKNDSIMYIAYVLRNDYQTPKVVSLFREEDLMNLIDDNDPQKIYKDHNLSNVIWGKLLPYLKGAKNIYFAPDGILHKIAIEYLSNLEVESVILNSLNLHRLSSTREIVTNKQCISNKNAVVFGGIKYDTDINAMEIESQKYGHKLTRACHIMKNITDSISIRSGLDFLPFTFDEAMNIHQTLTTNNFLSTLLTGDNATEESFKDLSGKANGIIHVSTHGFYWTINEATRRAGFNNNLKFMDQLGNENTRASVEDKALLRSGLFMAGAKNVLSGKVLPPDLDDGILTAQEISNIDLRGLDLVVLSACQTGMGEINGDGVFGLQRGFKKAGANSILMSLWNVDDEATQILMTEFYKNYLGGMSKRESLLAAQKTVRETPGFEDPEYWAAFILLDGLN